MQLDIDMKARSKELLDRAIAAMVAAIEIYNKPSFPYRAEAFSILAINGWELILKAKWLAEHNNRATCLYVYETRQKKTDGKNSKKRYVKRTDAGNPFTHSLSYLGNKLIESKKLNPLAWNNIQVLIELRDSCIHFYNQSPIFRVRLQEIGAACAKNFATAVQDWFGRPLSEFELHLMPLAFLDLPTCNEGFLLNAEEKNFLSFLESVEQSTYSPDSPYAVAVNIEIKFIRSKAKDALTAHISNDPTAIPVRLTPEQTRERYPWDYKTLTEKCQNRYSNFKVSSQYHILRKQVQEDPKYGHMRYLDENNPGSGKKPYFNPNILNEFDKCYALKTT